MLSPIARRLRAFDDGYASKIRNLGHKIYADEPSWRDPIANVVEMVGTPAGEGPVGDRALASMRYAVPLTAAGMGIAQLTQLLRSPEQTEELILLQE